MNESVDARIDGIDDDDEKNESRDENKESKAETTVVKQIMAMVHITTNDKRTKI